MVLRALMLALHGSGACLWLLRYQGILGIHDSLSSQVQVLCQDMDTFLVALQARKCLICYIGASYLAHRCNAARRVADTQTTTGRPV